MRRIAKALRWAFCHRIDYAWLYVGVGAIASICSVTACFARLSWSCDLFSNFIPQYALALLVCCAALLLCRRWLCAACLAPFLALCLAFIAPLYLPPPMAHLNKDGAPHYKLLSFNVLASNRNIERMLSFIDAEDPDFIVITEYTANWADAAEKLSKRYKLQILEPQTDCFGIAFFGRFNAEPHLAHTEAFGLPTHCADFKLPDGKQLRIVGTHSFVPKSRMLAEERQKCLLQCAKLCREAGMPSLLTGDFNITPFSPFYEEILKEGKLASASQGRGLCFSWPTWSFLHIAPFFMQLDHCLVSDGIETLSWRRGPDLGSDHYPVLVEFAVAGHKGS